MAFNKINIFLFYFKISIIILSIIVWLKVDQYYRYLPNSDPNFNKNFFDTIFKKKEINVFINKIGDDDAENIIIYLQGGPIYDLDEDVLIEIYSKLLDTQKYCVISVKQMQMFEHVKDFLSNNEITFEYAHEINKNSLKILDYVVKKYKHKNIYLIANSYGAFLAQKYISEFDTKSFKNIILIVGRIKMEEKFWKIFSQGKPAYFEKGFDIKQDFDSEETISQKNAKKIAASLGRHNYINLLKNVNLSNVLYLYGKLDENVGSLKKEEIEFLKSKKVYIFESQKDHQGAVDEFILDAFEYVNIKIKK